MKYEMLYLIPSQYADDELNGVMKRMAGMIEKAGGKVPKDLSIYIEGCNEANFSKVAYETTLDLASMKVNIGKIGALTDVIAYILSISKETLSLALKFKEHVTQTLLDSKHGTETVFDQDKLVAMFNRQGKYKDLGTDLIAEDAALMGINKELILQLLNLLSPLGIYKQIRDLPEIALSRGLSSMTAINTLYNGISSAYGIASMIKEIQNVFDQPKDVSKVWKEHGQDQLQDMPF